MARSRPSGGPSFLRLGLVRGSLPSMLLIGGAGAPGQAVRPMVGPPTPSLNQSGEEPANGERNTRRARPEVRATGREVAARFGPLDPLAGDARSRRRSGRACRRRADDG